MPRHPAGDGVDGVLDGDAALGQELGQVGFEVFDFQGAGDVSAGELAGGDGFFVGAGAADGLAGYGGGPGGGGGREGLAALSCAFLDGFEEGELEVDVGGGDGLAELDDGFQLAGGGVAGDVADVGGGDVGVFGVLL